MSFRIRGLPAAEFADVFALSDEALAARRAVRQKPDRPAACRVSLTDSAPGQEVILIHYVNHPVETPYRASYAIYVREGEQTYDEVDQVPEQLRRRVLSVRAYDGDGMIVDAALVDGSGLQALIPQLFAEQRTGYLHVHFAQFGCYAARIERA